MASTFFTQLGVVWLEPGQSIHLWWNNAHYNRVYAFNVSPIAQSPGTVCEAEVARVWRTHSYETGEAEAHSLVKNTGSSGGYCYVFMSTVSP
jgi:hypothetical protein